MEDRFDEILLNSIGEGASSFLADIDSGELKPGERVSHYRIVERVGQGGMGIVYKAEDETLGRYVALKFLARGPLDNDHLREMLEREARAASALNHPSICTIHSIEEDDDRRFIVMEYLEGETLKDRLARGPIPENEAIRIVLAVASALEASHARNILHCDIKPANVFLAATGAVKVLDFGIAKLKRDVATQVRQAVRDGLAAGTREYMSPEQARGEELDQRTDIFSLGAVLRDAVQEPSHALSRVIEKMMHPDRRLRFQTAQEAAEALASIQRSKAGRPRRIAISIAAAAALLAAAALWWWMSHPAPLAARDWILVADFDNRTQDTIFDDVLRDAVAAQVSQSPYVNVFPASRIDEQLKLMRRPPDQRLVADVARDMCERVGIKAYLAGSVASVGSHYLFRLDAVNAHTGEYISRQAIDVDSKEAVLKAVGQALDPIRKNLGESYASIRKFDVPIETATTSSLEALRAFRQGENLMARGTSAASKAVPLFKRAIEIDPDFALAYARLSNAFTNLKEDKLAADAARAAFDRRTRVSERERLQIETRYYNDVTGEYSKAMSSLEMWEQTYPEDPYPHNALMIHYRRIGQLEKSADEGEKAVQLVPTSALYRSNLCGSYLRLTALEKAEQVCQAAVRDKLDNTTTHRFLHLIALLRGDREGILREEAWRAKGTSDYANTEFQASIAGANGRLREARSLYPQAIQLTERSGLTDRAAEYRGRFALLEAFFENRKEAVSIARNLLKSDSGRSATADGVIALAIAGDETAIPTSEQMIRESPLDEHWKNLWIPMTRGILAVQSGNPAAGLDDLKSVKAYDRGDDALMYPSYYLGLAYLALHSPSDARREFQNVIDNRGVVATMPLYGLALVGTARATALGGSRQDAIAAYEKFFEAWKNADADLAIMKDARAEYSRLRGPS
jgi:eukaryotic-like serine/threonine-protein kinase